MNSPFHQKSHRGSAIIIVILFLVLVSGLVFAFFSFSNQKRRMVAYSTEEVRTLPIMRGAIDTILRDLSDEIEVNSDVLTITPEKKIYQPKRATSMNPSRSVKVPKPQWEVSSSSWSDRRALNLLKQSIHKTPFHLSNEGSVPSRASSVSTLTPDLGGRYLRPSFWSQPKLMKEDSSLKEEETPDWIYVTRNGENPMDFRESLRDKTPINDDFVVGRYAYQIYDVGGLLDMTAAGFYPKRTPIDTVGKKGGILMADLRSIPGFSDLSDSKLSELFTWRNKGPWEFIGGFFTYGERYGWRIPYATSDDNDNTFVSRSDLIRYFSTLFGEKAASKALPYLSNFERTLDIPSYRPHPNRPKIKQDPLYVCGVGGRNPSGGRNTAYGEESLINPDLSTLVESDGTPKLKNRFPLSRLAFVKTPKPGSRPAESDRKLALKYFGLDWNTSENCWTIDDTKLKNLKDLNTLADRKANFFEVLKAGINVGSLGQSRLPNSALTSTALGPIHVQTAMPNPYGGAYATDETVGKRFDRDRSVNIHLLQIGANIIDQADEDGYPTRIQYVYLGNTYDIYGTENIPYPNYWMMVPYRHQALDVTKFKPAGDPSFTPATIAVRGYPDFTTYPPYIGAWLTHVGVWNPHRPPSNTASERPTLFRVTADTDVKKTGTLVRKLSAGHYHSTGASTYWTANGGSTRVPSYDYTQAQWNTRKTDLKFAIKDAELGTDPLGLKYVYANPNYLTPSKNWIKFQTTTAGDASFRMPFTLKTTSYPTGAQITVPPTIAIPAGSNYSNDIMQNAGVTDQPPYRNMEFNVVANDYQNPTTDARFPWSSTVIGFLHGYFYLGPIGSIPTGTPASVAPPTMGISGLGIHFEFQYSSDGGATWWPYAEMELPSDNEMGQANIANRNITTWVDTGVMCGMFPDPRTRRFESFRSNGIRIGNPNVSTVKTRLLEGNTMRTGSGILSAPPSGDLSFASFSQGRQGATISWGSAWRPNPATIPMYMDTFTVNKPSKMIYSPQVYYEDPDGIVRPGIGVNEQANGGVGNPMQQTALSPVPPADPNDPFYQGRPTILDRPFRSVAELGYVSRAVPWKHIDLSTPTSGDSALLDLFCIEENEDNPDGSPLKPARPRVIAGRVNLNTPHPEVIEALLRGVLKDQGEYLQKSEAQAIARKLIGWTSSKGDGAEEGMGPLTNVSDLVGRLVDPTLKTNQVLDQGYAGFTSQLPSCFTSVTDQSVKSRIESVVRSLADGGQVRTWNLMIDLVTQSGNLSPQSQSLRDFKTRSEKHHWVHVAIDRLTGEVLDMQWETVN